MKKVSEMETRTGAPGTLRENDPASRANAPSASHPSGYGVDGSVYAE